MAELKLMGGLEELSDRAEALHEEVYQNIRREVPDLQKRDIYVDFTEEDLEEPKSPGKTIPIEGLELTWGIGLHPAVANFDEGYEEYLYFKKNQEEKMKEVSPDDFFKWVLSHEYGHMFGEKGSPLNVFEMYGDFGLEDQERILRYKKAIGEGFAYWFGDSISEFKEFNPMRALTHLEKADPKLLKEMYEVYRKIERGRGRKFVIQNHEDIAMQYVAWRERNSRE